MINIPLPKILLIISKELIKRDAKMILVGGCVRDSFLKIGIKDYDIEVYGLNTLEALEEILQSFGKVKLVGKSFGILKFVHEEVEYDFAFPRTEEKIGKGHRGFSVCVDGRLEFKEAAKRRDFTINAMGYDTVLEEFLDPFNGRDDLNKKILRHVDTQTFVEDPLRLYRGIQFCARFELMMHHSTKQLCQKMIADDLLDELPKERIFDEIKKLFLKSNNPSIGWKLLRELGGFKYFTTLDKLSEELFQKSMNRIDKMASLVKNFDEKEALILMFSSIFLNVDKSKISKELEFLSDEVKFIDSVVTLVTNFSNVDDIFKEIDNDTLLRRLSTKVKLKWIVYLAKASEYKYTDILEKKVKSLGLWEKAPVPFLQGRDLLSIGYKPSVEFKKILSYIYDLQLDGKVKNKQEAILIAKEMKK